jgi:hypothetical protein
MYQGKVAGPHQFLKALLASRNTPSLQASVLEAADEYMAK